MATTRPTLPPKPKPKPKKKPEPEKRYVCGTCGREYLKQMGNFPKLNIPKYEGNDGYCTTCVECVTNFYSERLKLYDGNTAKAVRRTCEWLDVYWSPRVFEKMTGGITTYFSKVALMTKGAVTWENTLNEEAETPILEAGSINPTDMPVIDDVMTEAITIFGEGYDVDAYPFMLSTYKGYIEPLGDTATASQVKSARFLAALEYRVMDAIKHDKPNASALSSSLSRAIKDSGFDVVIKSNSDDDHQPFGVWLAQIEQYAPADLVHDSPYTDMDNQEEYYSRFVRRPIENLLNRASQKQSDELAITDEEAASVDVGDADD